MSIAVEVKTDTHYVIKKTQLDALLEREQEAFKQLLNKIFVKYPERVYAICNIDEPYYDRVKALILNGEAEKAIRKLGPKKA